MIDSNKIILDLCGGTGSWSLPYKQNGYDVRIITLPNDDVRLWPSQPSELPRLPSGFNDIAEYIGNVHGILAAPVWAMYGGKSDKTKEMRSITPARFAQAFFKANQ